MLRELFGDAEVRELLREEKKKDPRKEIGAGILFESPESTLIAEELKVAREKNNGRLIEEDEDWLPDEDVIFNIQGYF